MRDLAITEPADYANVPAVASAPSTLPSVFDDYRVFQQTLQMAQALAKSVFVPPAFRGSPESCLIALDLSRRLGVSPLTIFPHLYVIDNKPSFSTQFLITLVNRSGVFSRLEFDEGIDGELEATFTEYNFDRSKSTHKETVPNYYAVARMTELATGKVYESPRVDIRFAELNGWTSKPGSKWRTMPSIMCAYRAASILIKRVCPEITLGLDFAEDARDAAPDPIQSSDGVASIPAPSYDSPAEFEARIAKATSEDELRAVGSAIAAANLPPAVRPGLVDAYRAKREELAAEAKAQAEEPAPKQTKTRTRKAKQEPTEETAPAEEPARESAENELIQAIREAANAEALNDARNAIEIATANGGINGETFGRLSDMIEARAIELEESAPEPTESQKRNYAASVAMLKRCKDGEGVDHLAKLAKTYETNGSFTSAQLTSFVREAEEFRKTLLV